MRSIEFSSATTAPSPKTLQANRIEASGVSASTASALAEAFFPATKRDDCALLAGVTANRVSASTLEAR